MNISPFIDKFYSKYSGNMGKMLVHTGVIGWILSSAAQICAIMFNDKIPKKQKMFLIPQETADAIINIVSFYAVTRTFCGVAQQLGKTGKWIHPVVKNFLTKNNLAAKIGTKGFDIGKLKIPKDVKNTYNWFSQGLEVAGTTLGAILSCNVITPIARNIYASWRQKDNIAKMNSPEAKCNPLYDSKECCLAKRNNVVKQPVPYSGSLKI